MRRGPNLKTVCQLLEVAAVVAGGVGTLSSRGGEWLGAFDHLRGCGVAGVMAEGIGPAVERRRVMVGGGDRAAKGCGSRSRPTSRTHRSRFSSLL